MTLVARAPPRAAKAVKAPKVPGFCRIERGGSGSGGTQWAKFAKKVHKPLLRVYVINFELNGFNASIWVP
jgi:hypothetical protein